MATSIEGRILGLLQANVSSFGVTDDGSTVGAIFSDFVIGPGGRDAPVPGQPGLRRHERGMTIALAPPAGGARLQIDLRGYYRAAGAGPAPGLSLSAAGKDFPVTLPDGVDEIAIDQSFEVPLPEATTQVSLAVVATRTADDGQAGKEGNLGVNTLDVALIAPAS